jgi:hypothetical protein
MIDSLPQAVLEAADVSAISQLEETGRVSKTGSGPNPRDPLMDWAFGKIIRDRTRLCPKNFYKKFL